MKKVIASALTVCGVAVAVASMAAGETWWLTVWVSISIVFAWLWAVS